MESEFRLWWGSQKSEPKIWIPNLASQEIGVQIDRENSNVDEANIHDSSKTNDGNAEQTDSIIDGDVEQNDVSQNII